MIAGYCSRVRTCHSSYHPPRRAQQQTYRRRPHTAVARRRSGRRGGRSLDELEVLRGLRVRSRHGAGGELSRVSRLSVELRLTRCRSRLLGGRGGGETLRCCCGGRARTRDVELLAARLLELRPGHTAARWSDFSADGVTIVLFFSSLDTFSPAGSDQFCTFLFFLPGDGPDGLPDPTLVLGVRTSRARWTLKHRDPQPRLPLTCRQRDCGLPASRTAGIMPVNHE